MSTITIPVLVLVGPTAIGKTSLALEIARRHECDIISMDSMQVYRYMDIGTAKPTVAEQAAVRHHLLDILDPDEQYSASRFVQDCQQVLHWLEKQGRAALITGGTGLYLKALLQGLFKAPPSDPAVRALFEKRLEREGRQALYREFAALDPAMAFRIHIHDTQRLLRGLEIHHLTGMTWSEHLARQQAARPERVFTRLLQLGLRCERSRLYARIEKRSRIMLEQGLLDEVEKLLAMGYGPDLPAMQSIGYRHAVGYLLGRHGRETMEQTLVRDTRRYAKRQMTWFTRQADLQWYHRDAGNEVLAAVARFMAKGTGKAQVFPQIDG